MIGSFIVDVATAGDESFVTCSGEFDIATADRFREGIAQALAADSRHLHVDCSGVSFIDSIGISSLAHLVTLAAREGVEVRFNFSERVLRVLETSGLIERLRSPLAAAGRPANAV